MIKLSKRDNRDLEQKAKGDISHIRMALKKEPIVIKMFKDAGRDINEVDNMSIQFDQNLDVSAKTVNGKIYLNAEMLKEKWQEYFHYLIHETKHYITHTSGKCDGDDKNVPYLDNPEEIAAFKDQLKYREKTEPKKDVVQYVEDLMDKHNTPANERPAKKKQLMGK